MIGFEPVPHFYAFYEWNMHVNGFMPLVDMRTNVISHESGKELEVGGISSGCVGGKGQQHRAVDMHMAELAHP